MLISADFFLIFPILLRRDQCTDPNLSAYSNVQINQFTVPKQTIDGNTPSFMADGRQNLILWYRQLVRLSIINYIVGAATMIRQKFLPLNRSKV